MGEKAMKGKAITKVLSCLVVSVLLMSTFSVAVLATDSSNSTASNVTLNLNDEANSSVESVALSNNITCLTCRDDLIQININKTETVVNESGNSDLPGASNDTYAKLELEYANTSSPDIISESGEVPDPDLPVINDTDIDTFRATAKTVSSTSSCIYVWIKITDKYCKGYKVYVDGVYQFTEGESGTPDGYCCFKVTPGYHTFKLTLNGKEVSKGWNCQCGVVYNWMSMNDMIPHWCEDDGGGDCDNPPTVSFDKSKYYEGDTVHITVSEPTIYGASYQIKDCSGITRKSGTVSYGTSSIYYTLPTISSCCYWKICFYWNPNVVGPLGSNNNQKQTKALSSNDCVKCYSFYVCPHETPCKVWINVEDKYCKGYKVYVDGVYQFTEGESGTPDGYCRFWVTPGTHKFELRTDGCSVSKSWYCYCGTVYHWVSMNDMDPHWCECNKPTPPPVKEVKFRGTVTGTSPEGLIGAIHWYVSVDGWISGSLPCDEIDVVIAMCPPFGSYDNSISKGDKVEVYGVVNPFGSDICTVGLNGESYYIKKIEEKWDVKFQGTVTGTEDPYIEDFICEARIDKIISGAEYIEEGWTVNIILSAHDSPCGTYEEVKKGDKIEVFGQRLPVYCWPPQISLCGRSSYYLKKTEEKKANLIIQDIYWGPKDPKAGDKVTFAVTVKNQADRRINGEIDFYIDGEFKEGKGGETSAGYFSPGDTKVYHFDWTAETGAHTIKFVTNPDDMLTGENGEDEKSIKFDICSEDEIKFIGTYLYSCVPLMSFHGYVFSIDEVLAGKNLTGKAIIVYADTGPKYKNELPFFVPTLLNLTKGDKVVIYARAETKWEGLWDLKLPSDKYYIHKYRDHSAYINYLSGVGPFYGNYSNIILDPTFWINLEKERMEGVTESLMKDVGTTAVVTAITTLYPAATATLGKLSTITFPLTIVLILINEGERETYIAIGDAIYYADPGQLRVLLITLQNNGEYLKTVINEENSYSKAALDLRQWTILSAYEELCSFDQRFLNNLRDTTITNKASQYNFAQKYIAMLANELIVDYALTTIELNDLTGENEEVFLPKVSECELQSHCFQGIGGISNCFGYFNSKEDTDKYEITTSPSVSYLYIYLASPGSWHLKVTYILKQAGEEVAQGNNNGGLWVSSPSGIYELDVKSEEGAGCYGFDIYGVNIKPIE